MRWVWTAILFAWKYVVGSVLCFSLLGSVLVVGWTYRAMQRTTRQRWASYSLSLRERAGVRGQSTEAPHPVIAESIGYSEVRRDLEHLPNSSPLTPTLSRRERGQDPWPSWITQWRTEQPTWRRVVGSLWLNAKIGGQGIFNTWVLTLPPCVLWLFGWYDGWNNSFHKGYEQSWVGPAISWLGIVLFIAVMFYVPMAQARQASSGDWRSFYDWRTVRAVIRRRWYACVGLAAAYALASLPVSVLKTAPLVFDRAPDYATLTDAQVLDRLRGYFLLCCFVVFPLFVALRLLAARVYAGGLLAAVRAGEVAAADLGETEDQTLRALEIHEPIERSRPHAVVRAATGLGWRLGRLAGGVATALLWFAFLAQIYVSEFLNYHLVLGWLNQPLVQLPWFRYLP